LTKKKTNAAREISGEKEAMSSQKKRPIVSAEKGRNSGPTGTCKEKLLQTRTNRPDKKENGAKQWGGRAIVRKATRSWGSRKCEKREQNPPHTTI